MWLSWTSLAGKAKRGTEYRISNQAMIEFSSNIASGSRGSGCANAAGSQPTAIVEVRALARLLPTMHEMANFSSNI